MTVVNQKIKIATRMFSHIIFYEQEAFNEIILLLYYTE